MNDNKNDGNVCPTSEMFLSYVGQYSSFGFSRKSIELAFGL